MKKSILFFSLLLSFFCISLSSCTSCKNETLNVYHDYDGIVQDFTAGVSHIQAMHRQTMFQLLKDIEKQDSVKFEYGYEWRNSRVIFNDTITIDNIDQLHVTDINDRFCYWHPKKGMQVQFIDVNVVKGTQIPWPINDVWIEDGNLSNKSIKLSAEDVLQRLKEWNGVLPTGCNFITLRLPVGPIDCNPQWTFGDVFNILFIDAVTGEINDCNPAFSKEKESN